MHKEADYLVFCLHVMYHRTLESSDLKPFIDIIGRSDPGYRWDDEVIELGRDPFLAKECQNFRDDIEIEWGLISAVLESHSEFF